MEMLNLSTAAFIGVFTALFPIINPLGGAPIFFNMVQGCSPAVRNQLAKTISINCFSMLFVSMLVGPQLLLFFGISLSALKLAGGVVLISMGWSLLNQKSTSDKNASNESGITDTTASSNAFFPLTMPLTAGPGVMASAIALVAGSKHSEGFNFANSMPSIIGALLGLLALSITVYFSYREASSLQRLLGPNGTNVLMRLFSFILLAIGVQVFLGGLEGFAGQVYKELAVR